MTWRLVLGGIVTQRRSLVGAVVMAGLVSRPTPLEWLTTVAVVWIAAAAGADTALAKRELVVLPVSPKELNRAGWILAAVLPLAVLTLARILGGAWHAFSSEDGWAFHTTPVRVLFDVVYFSLTGAWAVGRPDRYEPFFREDPNLYRFMFGVLVMAVVPFIVIPRLPETFGEIPAMLWVVVVAALGAGLAPLFRTPEWPRRESPPTTSPEPTPLPLKIQGEVVPLPASRIEGIWVPMRGVAGQALLWTVITVGFAVIGQYMKSGFTIWGPFDESITTVRFLTTIGLFPLLLLGLCPSLGSWIGALKRLPVSARSAALLLSLAPTTAPVIFWATLLLIHMVSSWQSPDVLRLGLLTAYIGAASLADALGTKAGSSMAKFAVGALVVMAVAYGIDENRPLLTAVVEHWALPLAGLLCLGLSWLVNLHTWTRSRGSSRVFRFNRSTQSMGAR
jgi:hypothetical protein